MKKHILILLLVLLLPPVAVYAWFALTSGHHHYTQDNALAFWLYTPDSLKSLPAISNHSVYSYSFNPDTQQTRVTIIWSNIDNIASKKKELSRFIKMFNGLNKYNCVWIYNDKNNYAENYQRYCIFQKENTLELEFFET